MADVKDGVGIYLAVYLLTDVGWNPGKIGMVMAIPWLIGIIVTPGVGALIDKTRFKRHLLIIGSIAIAFSAVLIIYWPTFWPIVLAQLLVGVFQAIYPPAIASISLGIVGHERLSPRIGRNESFNHAGNMIAAIINVGMALYISYHGIFYFSILQCLLIVVATLLIREKDIDHKLARAAKVEQDKEVSAARIGDLFSNRNTVMFIIAMFLFSFSNGYMLPLLGQKISVHDPRNSSVYLSICIIIAQAVMVVVAWIIGKNADMSRKKLFMLAFIILPIRPILFSLIEHPYVLTGIQVLDGLTAGVYGVLIILMMADLSKGTGRFNLLQGAVYCALGVGMALSTFVTGKVSEAYGFNNGFRFLAAISIVACLFFTFFVKETKENKLKVENEPNVV